MKPADPASASAGRAACACGGRRSGAFASGQGPPNPRWPLWPPAGPRPRRRLLRRRPAARCRLRSRRSAGRTSRACPKSRRNRPRQSPRPPRRSRRSPSIRSTRRTPRLLASGRGRAAPSRHADKAEMSETTKGRKGGAASRSSPTRSKRAPPLRTGGGRPSGAEARPARGDRAHPPVVPRLRPTRIRSRPTRSAGSGAPCGAEDGDEGRWARAVRAGRAFASAPSRRGAVRGVSAQRAGTGSHAEPKGAPKVDGRGAFSPAARLIRRRSPPSRLRLSGRSRRPAPCPVSPPPARRRTPRRNAPRSRTIRSPDSIRSKRKWRSCSGAKS